MAASLVFVLLSLALTSTNALDKQIKLEDIERDNLQTEVVRRPQHQTTAQQEQINQLRQQQQLHLQQQQQLHRQQQLAYQQQLLQQRYTAAQEPRYSATQAERYSAAQAERYSTPQAERYSTPQAERYSTPQAERYSTPQAERYSAQEQQQPLTYHQQFQQQIQQHREHALLRERERSEPQHHQALQHYAPTQQLLQEVAAAGTPHVMYLIMPGGNIAAIPIAHPNQIQALFAPLKPHYTPYQASQVALPTQAVQAYYQPQPQTIPVHTPTQSEPEQPRTQLQYVVPSQQHRITFSQARPEYSQTRHEYSPSQQTVVYRESPQTETEYQYTPQSQKSIYSSGVKSTAAPQSKGATAFSTQTGSSYANFRQYSG